MAVADDETLPLTYLALPLTWLQARPSKARYVEYLQVVVSEELKKGGVSAFIDGRSWGAVLKEVGALEVYFYNKTMCGFDE